MAQCNWDPAKHNGKPCPVHGASGTENNTGHKLRINGGKYQVKYSDSSDYEDTDKETFDHLRETASQDFDENIDDDFGFDEENEEYEPLTENDIATIKKYADKYELPFDGLKQVIEEETQKRVDNGDSYANAKNDAMEDVLGEVVSRGNFESFLKGESDESSPMNEFSGPDREGPSYAQLDAKAKNKPSIDYDEIARRKANEEPKDEMGIYLDKQIDPKVADRIRKAGNEIAGAEKPEDGIKYLAPEEIGIDYDNPEASIRYYEKKNNVKLYEQPSGSFKVVPNKNSKTPLSEVENTPQKTGMSEWDRKHQEFLEKGKSTWNQKLKKGDKITIEDKDGNDVEVYINGFYRDGELVDEDSYEEGKDNNWHDFRGVSIADKDGKPLGSVNAFQIKKHERPQTESKASMTSEQRQQIRQQINKMVASLDDSRSIDEAWDIEQGVIELEEMLKKFKGK